MRTGYQARGVPPLAQTPEPGLFDRRLEFAQIKGLN